MLKGKRPRLLAAAQAMIHRLAGGAARRDLPAALLCASIGLAHAAEKLSEAEVMLFMTDHFGASSAPTSLIYDFSRSGSMEPAFRDTVQVSVKPGARGAARTISTRCLSGTSKVELPEVSQVEGNPALLCFLERDIREMERLTGGKANYFRKRIRIALAQQAQVRPVTLDYAGKQVEGKEIRISPYLNDPLRERFERYAGKFYVFRLSSQIPGTIHEIDAVIPDAGKSAGAQGTNAPLVEEVLSFARTEPAGKKDK
jgi:hypothetical protein